MRSFLKGAAMVAVLALAAMPALAPMAAFAQSASSSVLASVPPDSTTIVTVPYGDLANQVLDIVGTVAAAAVAALVALAASMLPGWLRPLITASVETAIGHFIDQGVNYAIQEVEGFDKDKTISLNVGNAGVASALNYVVAQAPGFLIKLAGGKDAVISKIIAFLSKFGIVLDTGVAPAAVAAQVSATS